VQGFEYHKNDVPNWLFAQLQEHE